MQAQMPRRGRAHAAAPHHAWQDGGVGTDTFPPGEKKPGWQIVHVGLPAQPGAQPTHAAADAWLCPGSVVVPFAQRMQLAEGGGAPPALQVPSGHGAQPSPPVPGMHTVVNSRVCPSVPQHQTDRHPSYP